MRNVTWHQHDGYLMTFGPPNTSNIIKPTQLKNGNVALKPLGLAYQSYQEATFARIRKEDRAKVHSFNMLTFSPSYP